MALSENSILNMLNVESDLTNLSKIRISCSTSFTHVLGIYRFDNLLKIPFMYTKILIKPKELFAFITIYIFYKYKYTF